MDLPALDYFTASGRRSRRGALMAPQQQPRPDGGIIIAGMMLAIGFITGRCTAPTSQPAEAPQALAAVPPEPNSSSSSKPAADRPLQVRLTAAESSAFYANCSEARAAGAAPIYAGQPGYRSRLDRDGDGIACE